MSIKTSMFSLIYQQQHTIKCSSRISMRPYKYFKWFSRKFHYLNYFCLETDWSHCNTVPVAFWVAGHSYRCYEDIVCNMTGILLCCNAVQCWLLQTTGLTSLLLREDIYQSFPMLTVHYEVVRHITVVLIHVVLQSRSHNCLTRTCGRWLRLKASRSSSFRKRNSPANCSDDRQLGQQAMAGGDTREPRTRPIRHFSGR